MGYSIINDFSKLKRNKMLDSFLKISYFHGKQYLWGMRVSGTGSLIWVQSWAQSPGLLPVASLHMGSCVPMGVGHLVGCEIVHHTLSQMPLFWPHWLSTYSTSRWLSSGPEFSCMGFPSQPFVFVLFLLQFSQFGGLPDVLTSWPSSMLFPIRSLHLFPHWGLSWVVLSLNVFFPFQGIFFAWCFQNFFFSWPCLS